MSGKHTNRLWFTAPYSVSLAYLIYAISAINLEAHGIRISGTNTKCVDTHDELKE